MKKITTLTLSIALVVASPNLFAVNHGHKQVGSFEAMWVNNDCMLFTLIGVAEADPIKPGIQWFAMSRQQAGFPEAYAALLAAKVSGARVTVGTTGQLACDYAEVGYVLIVD